MPAAAFGCAVAAVGSVFPEPPELSEGLVAVCDCAVEDVLASAAFGAVSPVVETTGVGVAAVAVVVVVAAGTAVPLMPVCTVACGFVGAAALAFAVGWVAPFASVVAAVAEVVPGVAAAPPASACAAADVDWSAAASAAAAMASGAVLELLVAAAVGSVGVLVSITVTGSMTAIAVGKIPVVTVDDEPAVESLVGPVVVLPSDDDCVLDVDESSFESADLSLACRGPSLPLAWSAPSALEACLGPLF